MKNTNGGITLIALVITIVVLLILAGVSIAMLTGNNGLITKADYAKLKTEVSQMQEELELFKTGKISENNGFLEDTLSADQLKVTYNTKNDTKENTINDILPTLNKWKYKENIEIAKGKLIFVSQDLKLIEMAKKLGLDINPYKIENGELKSSESNLALMDSTGTLELPSSVTSIGEGAFSQVEGLKKIIIPGTCKIIGTNAFANNQTLEEVILEEGVEIIGNSAFKNCINLHTVEMANTVKEIRNSAFYGNSNLKDINLSNNLNEIGNYAFLNCAFQEIVIPNNIVQINPYIFDLCKNLHTVKISKNVSDISPTAFTRCPNLENIEIEQTNKNFIFEKGILINQTEGEMVIIFKSAISGNIFEVPEGIKKLYPKQLNNYPQISQINIPSSVINIDANFIETNITSVNINDQNEKYETYQNAIYEKNEETQIREKLIKYYGVDANIKIEEGIKSISSNAFYNKEISNISLPNSLEKLDNYSLATIHSTTISLGQNVSYIDPLFIYGSDVTNLVIASENPYYFVENDILYKKDSTEEGKKELVLPIEPIGKITTFEIPYGVSRIGNDAFQSQRNMTSIKIPETVTEIKNSFNYCSSLTKIEIPNSVIKINSTCFANSPNISEVIINKEKGSITGSPWGISKGERAIKWLK